MALFWQFCMGCHLCQNCDYCHDMHIIIICRSELIICISRALYRCYTSWYRYYNGHDTHIPFEHARQHISTMFLSHETNCGAFSFPFLNMSDMGCFLPRTVWFWDDSDGICDVLLELAWRPWFNGWKSRTRSCSRCWQLRHPTVMLKLMEGLTPYAKDCVNYSAW